MLCFPIDSPDDEARGQWSVRFQPYILETAWGWPLHSFPPLLSTFGCHTTSIMMHFQHSTQQTRIKTHSSWPRREQLVKSCPSPYLTQSSQHFHLCLVSVSKWNAMCLFSSPICNIQLLLYLLDQVHSSTSILFNQMLWTYPPPYLLNLEYQRGLIVHPSWRFHYPYHQYNHSILCPNNNINTCRNEFIKRSLARITVVILTLPQALEHQQWKHGNTEIRVHHLIVIGHRKHPQPMRLVP